MAGTGAQVAGLYRYPVKSMTGERLRVFDLDARGVVGDRQWSVRTRSGKIGSGKNTRRFETVPGLLRWASSTAPSGVQVTSPDGWTGPASDPAAGARLARELGVELSLAEEGEVSHFDDGPVSLLGTASVDEVATLLGSAVHAERFRPNLLLRTATPFQEDGWVGRDVALGAAVLRIGLRSPRCVMVDAQTARLPGLPGLLRATGTANRACLGVVATVVVPGRIAEGDELRLLE